jgi:hypothetical protein
MDDDSGGTTRRVALARFALAIGGLGIAGSEVANAAPLVQGALTTRRSAIFGALIGAFDGHDLIKPGSRDLVLEMQARYAASTDDYRAWVDVLLDAVDVAPAGARFADRNLKDKQATIRSWLLAIEPDDATLRVVRPTDAALPSDLRASNAVVAQWIDGVRNSLPAEALGLDPQTLLPAYAPPVTTATALPTGTPISSPVRLRRCLYHGAYVLLASFFIDDTRYL